MTEETLYSIEEWERCIYERVFERPNRVYLKDKEWGKYFPTENWLGFLKTGFEGKIFEDAFRDHFIEKMVKPNFKHWRKESQLFDIVAYRTSEDAKLDTPWYVWNHYLTNPNHAGVVSYLKRFNKTVLDPPPPFLGERKLYGFEIKTDGDNVYHFLDQLPRYAWLFDVVVLVIGEKQISPKRLPSWVEVWKRSGDEYVKIKSGHQSYSFIGDRAFSPAKWYMPHNNSRYEDFDYSGATSLTEFLQFLKRCVISALFKNEAVEPYTKVDREIYDSIRNHRRKRPDIDNIASTEVLIKPVSKSVESLNKVVSKSMNDFIEKNGDTVT